jgi:hypothetical protein
LKLGWGTAIYCGAIVGNALGALTGMPEITQARVAYFSQPISLTLLTITPGGFNQTRNRSPLGQRHIVGDARVVPQ